MKTSTIKRPRKKRSLKKRNKKRQKQQQRKRVVIELVVTSGIVLLVLVTVFFAFFRIERSDGYGMSPTIQANDCVLVNKQSTIERFSIVYFQVPNRQEQSLMRRVIGLPGEEIRYLDDELWVNGRQITERFLLEQLQRGHQEGYGVTEDFHLRDLSGDAKSRIPEGYYLVLGDNRSFSLDSREFGLVPVENITGVVELIVSPIQRVGTV